MNNRQYWRLLFDGECPLCTKFSEYVKRFDINKCVLAIPLQEYYKTDKSISIDSLMKDVHLLGDNGEILVGGDAVQQIILVIPQTKPFQWMLKGKAGKKISRAVYFSMKSVRSCIRCRHILSTRH